MALLNKIGAQLGTKVQFPGSMNGPGGMAGMGGMMSAPLQFSGGFGGGIAGPPDRSLQQIAHCLWALVAAMLGGTLSILLFGGRTNPAEEPDADPATRRRISRRAWLFRTAILSLSACVVATFLLAFLSRSAPDFWAGAAFLSTCALLGLFILGATGEQGSRRQIWLGAALMGAGYMTLAFARHPDVDSPVPPLPTEQLLHAIRGWLPSGIGSLPASWSGTAAANLRIWQALERPVPMPFPAETALENVLKYVDAATRGPDGKGIPIYVDPIGLGEAEKTMTSVAAIDLDGVPLKTSLRLCLAQLDLAYSIRDGVLLITSTESARTPVYQDPFLTAGHSLLALLAAGLGALLAPLLPSRAASAHRSPTPPTHKYVGAASLWRYPSALSYRSRSPFPKTQNTTILSPPCFSRSRRTASITTPHASSAGYPKIPVLMHGNAMLESPFSRAAATNSHRPPPAAPAPSPDSRHTPAPPHESHTSPGAHRQA